MASDLGVLTRLPPRSVVSSTWPKGSSATCSLLPKRSSWKVRWTMVLLRRVYSGPFWKSSLAEPLAAVLTQSPGPTTSWSRARRQGPRSPRRNSTWPWTSRKRPLPLVTSASTCRICCNSSRLRVPSERASPKRPAVEGLASAPSRSSQALKNSRRSWSASLRSSIWWVRSLASAITRRASSRCAKCCHCW